MPKSTPAPPRARMFAETGWSRVPIELEDAGLSPQSFRLYAHYAAEADKGNDPPLNDMAPAVACGMTIEQVRAAQRDLIERGMLILENATDWTLTDPTTWRSKS